MTQIPSSWMLTVEPPADAKRQGWHASLPQPAIDHDLQHAGKGTNHPSGYIPDQALIDAFNAAICLGQPLLITGEPGCGKTDAANYLAWRLGLDHSLAEGGLDAAMRYDVKSTTSGRDLFYGFDFVRRYYAAQIGDKDLNDYAFITLNALGRAILESSSDAPARALLAALAPAGTKLPAPRRSVVLIDEIDKAPRETPNDLLMEIEKMRFHLAELNQTFRADAALQPIVVMTSNSERALPDAFLRRCVFHVMVFPKDNALRTIIANRVGPLDKTVSDQAIGLLERLRERRLHRAPGTAELVGFLKSLKGMELATGDLRGRKDWTRIARMTLLKNAEDQARLDETVIHGLVPA